jgi:cobalt transporter subunit CbtA
MITRVLSAGLLAGLLAGVTIAVLQNFTTTPLILAAEVYENAPDKAASLAEPAVLSIDDAGRPVVLAHAEEHAEGEQWAPAAGVERILYTSTATIACSIGFAFLLLAGMLIAGDAITERNAMVWAAAGFVVTGLAPGIGLSPEVPGMLAADLLARQSWWFLTAVLTAASLWLFLRSEHWGAKALAVALLIAPHILGAPHLAPGGDEAKIPAELAAQFAATSLAVHAALWIATGFAVGRLWPRLAGAAAHQTEARA